MLLQALFAAWLAPARAGTVVLPVEPVPPAPIAALPGAEAPGPEILVANVILAEGERFPGRDHEKAVEALLERHPGQARLLSADGPSSLFGAQTFALEVPASAKEEILRELRAIERLEAHPLADLVEAASGREAPPLQGEEDLAKLKERMDKGPLPERLRAFSQLASALESMAPERIAGLPEGARDAALSSLYDLAPRLGVNIFNLVQGDLRQRLREQAHAERGGEWDWVALEKAAHEGLKEPAAQARLKPLRGLIQRAIGAMDLLDTAAARQHVLHILPHAEYAGFELVATRPELKGKYAHAWLAIVAESVAETVAGLKAGRPEGWTGSNRSGGYEHLDDRRESMHLYHWKPGRFDPGELRHELLLLLGVPDPAFPLRWMILTILEHAQWRVPEMDALNREDRIRRDLEQRLSYLDHMAEEAAAQGRLIPPEALERFRQDAREQIESQYDEWSKVSGHSVLDRLLSSLTFSPYLSFVPGFDEALYVSSVLGLLSEANERLAEPGLLKQVADVSVSFVLSLIRAPGFLEAHPGLRAEATAFWRRVAAKAEQLGLPLVTRLDGVIDLRPQLGPEPLTFSQSDGRSGWIIWQAAVSPDGHALASAGADRMILVHDAATGRLLKTIRLMDAEQYYGDAANSLGVAWTPEGRLLVSTYHVKKGSEREIFNKVRAFDLGGAKEELGPEDAVSEAVVPGAGMLRHMPVGPGGQYLAGELPRYGNNGYEGADVRLWAMDGTQSAQIPQAALLDARGGSVLTAAPHGAPPRLTLWDASDPASPKDVTPRWLKDWTEAWRSRNIPRGRYHYWPRLRARLGAREGRPVILLHDAGFLEVRDLETGAPLRSFEVPNRWEAWPYATDAAGRFLATIVAAPGRFSGPGPERIMVWDLATGELVLERGTEDVSALDFSPDGWRLIVSERGKVSVFELAR